MVKKSFTTTISIFSSILSIIVSLLALHLMNIPVLNNQDQVIFSNNTFGTILFIITHLFIWTLCFIFNIGIYKKTFYNNIDILIGIVLGVINYCICMVLLDVYFNTDGLMIVKIMNGLKGSWDDLYPYNFEEFALLLEATMISSISFLIVKDKYCPNCRKLQMYQSSKTRDETYNQDKYVQDDDGNNKMIRHFYQKYNITKKCGNCGYKYSYRTSEYIGNKKYNA